MANHIYPGAKRLWQSTGLNILTSDIKAVLLRGYTYDAAHDNLDDIGGGLRVATSANMTGNTLTATVTVTSGGCTVTGPAFDVDNFSWTAVGAGAPCESVVFYYDSTVEATSTLICYIDTLTGLPITPNGQDITFVVDPGDGRLFVL